MAYNKNHLESLTRKELQALAKENGLKANSSSADIIANLMDISPETEVVVEKATSHIVEEEAIKAPEASAVESAISTKQQSAIVGSLVDAFVEGEWLAATVIRVNKKTIRVSLSDKGSEITVKLFEIRVREVLTTTATPTAIATRTVDAVATNGSCDADSDTPVEETSDPTETAQQAEVVESVSDIVSEHFVASTATDEEEEVVCQRESISTRITTTKVEVTEEVETKPLSKERRNSSTSAITTTSTAVDVKPRSSGEKKKKIIRMSSIAHTYTPVKKDAKPSIVPRSTKTQRIREEAVAQKLKSIIKETVVTAETVTTTTTTTATIAPSGVSVSAANSSNISSRESIANMGKSAVTGTPARSLSKPDAVAAVAPAAPTSQALLLSSQKIVPSSCASATKKTATHFNSNSVLHSSSAKKPTTGIFNSESVLLSSTATKPLAVSTSTPASKLSSSKPRNGSSSNGSSNIPTHRSILTASTFTPAEKVKLGCISDPSPPSGVKRKFTGVLDFSISSVPDFSKRKISGVPDFSISGVPDFSKRKISGVPDFSKMHAKMMNKLKPITEVVERNEAIGTKMVTAMAAAQKGELLPPPFSLSAISEESRGSGSENQPPSNILSRVTGTHATTTAPATTGKQINTPSSSSSSMTPVFKARPMPNFKAMHSSHSTGKSDTTTTKPLHKPLKDHAVEQLKQKRDNKRGDMVKHNKAQRSEVIVAARRGPFSSD